MLDTTPMIKKRAPQDGSLPSPLTQAQILSDALPFMQRYDNQTVVIKYGGHAMGDKDLARLFAKDIVQLKQSGVNPIVVHGGGPQIGVMLKRLGIESKFEEGLRVTDEETIEIVQMVLAGSINKEIVTAINAEGGKACGISGKDGNLMRVDKLQKTITDPNSNATKMIDLGFVGEPVEVNPHIVDVITSSDLIPVIAPLGVCAQGYTYNINADTFAGSLAGAIRAKRLLLLTDVAGVLNKNGDLIEELNTLEAQKMIKDGTINGGMIPKIKSCISVIEQGVEGVVILDGRVPHAVLLELFTPHGVGTLLEAH